MFSALYISELIIAKKKYPSIPFLSGCYSFYSICICDQIMNDWHAEKQL